MNIYGLFLMFVYLTNTVSFKTINSYTIQSKLFMKKNKTIFSYLYKPKSVNQNKYTEYLNDEDNKIIVSTGPAGTGKTLFACQKAITQMKNQEIDKIVITRPIVTIEEDIGFLPGNIIKKMDPWTKPIFDIFLEYYSKSELDLLLFNGKIEICPLVFMRGRTFKNSFIIADEMQNSSPNQMKMLTTRLGINSRMVITGDLNQTDILKENGLDDFMKKVKAYKNSKLIKFVTFNNDDVERSDIVKEVINLYSYIKPIEVIKNTTNVISNNDAALIPKHHITSNFDIYFGATEFY
jgi:phosphate starvation-inducible PhoH-like protein